MSTTADFINTANALPPYIRENQRWLVDRARQLADSRLGPEGLRGRGVAELSPQILEAIRLAQTQRGSMNPQLDVARDLGISGSSPIARDIPSYFNPYQEQVINRARDNSLRVFRERILPELENSFTQRGQHGSTRHADLARRAALMANEDIMAQEAAMRHRGYNEAANLVNSDRARELEAASRLGEIARLGHAGNAADIGLLSALGSHSEGRRQQVLDAEFDRYLREQRYPHEVLSNLSAVMNHFPSPNMQSTFSNFPLTPTLNTAGSIGATAMSALGALQNAQGNSSSTSNGPTFAANPVAALAAAAAPVIANLGSGSPNMSYIPMQPAAVHHAPQATDIRGLMDRARATGNASDLIRLAAMRRFMG